MKQTDSIKREWLRMLVRYSVGLFDHYTQVSLINNLNDPKRVVQARMNFRRFTGENTKKVISLLGLLRNGTNGEKKP
jgi:hypothetical protein